MRAGTWRDIRNPYPAQYIILSRRRLGPRGSRPQSESTGPTPVRNGCGWARGDGQCAVCQCAIPDSEGRSQLDRWTVPTAAVRGRALSCSFWALSEAGRWGGCRCRCWVVAGDVMAQGTVMAQGSGGRGRRNEVACCRRDVVLTGVRICGDCSWESRCSPGDAAQYISLNRRRLGPTAAAAGPSQE